MQQFSNFIGIDVSKKTFDAAIIKSSHPTTTIHQCFEQSADGYNDFINWLDEHQIAAGDATLFCLEHTGIYITGLVDFLVNAKANIWVEMALRIKRTLGLQRGTNDKAAAINIAQYAYRYQEQVKLWKPINTSIEQLKHLIAQRDRIVTSITQLTVPLNELEESSNAIYAKQLKKIQHKAIKTLEATLQNIETNIDAFIQQESTIKNTIKNVTSIKGIGKQTAVALFVYTNGFTSFQNAKQLACYCGVVPFNKSSGTSVRSKPGVSQFANHKLKKLLHLCAMAALQWDDEIRAYYLRKVAEGKNKMSVINAVRNKLLQRIFAVVRDNRSFVKNYQYAVNN